MKKMKRFMSLMLALVLAMAMGITAFAQTMDVGTENGTTITINNPAKGEKYSIYKLFDATVAENGNIAYQYQGENLPEGLEAYFVKDSVGNIAPADAILESDKETAKMTEELKVALEAWAKTATPVAEETSNGDGVLVFTGVPYGYYVITTSHTSDPADGEEVAKSAITVTSTRPDAVIYDKNVNEPNVDKTVEKESYSIGDTVKYTGTFDTTNYLGEGENSKQVINYVISDTLPEFLENVEVKSITVKQNGNDTSLPVQQFDNEKKITIQWATKNDDGTFTNLYAQGAQIVIEYEAVLTSITNINEVDTNTITLQPYVDNGPGTPDEGDPWEETWEDSAEITTYAAAVNKVDGNNQPLAGATFKIKGLNVVETAVGVYTVVSYDPESDEESMELATDEDGKLYIVGLEEGISLTVTEAAAPNGYNKLTESKTLTPQVLSSAVYKESGEKHYDKDGNLVSESSTETKTVTVTRNLEELDAEAVKIVNEQGTLLPSTGGIGTTIFYVVGAVLVLGAGILLVTRKRMSAR